MVTAAALLVVPWPTDAAGCWWPGSTAALLPPPTLTKLPLCCLWVVPANSVVRQSAAGGRVRPSSQVVPSSLTSPSSFFYIFSTMFVRRIASGQSLEKSSTTVHPRMLLK